MRSARVTLGFLLLCAAATAQQYLISTFAGGGIPATSSVAMGAMIGTPFAVTTDAVGNLYFVSSDINSVFKLAPNGVLTRVAGTATSSLALSTDKPGYLGDGGPATSARLSPGGAAVDGTGNLFIADSRNNRIRKVLPNGLIVTVAGDGAAGFSGDGGPATSARLNWPVRVAVDSAGNLFIADRGNYRVRKVSTNGIITTVAGTGACCFSGDGAPAISAAVVAVAVAVDSAGNLFIADSIHVRKVAPDGIITTVAGDGSLGGGPAIGGRGPWGVAVDRAGSLYITNICSIRKLTSGIITTVAGTCMAGGSSGDGGPATSVQLGGVFGVAVDGAGNLFIADSGTKRVLRVSPSGIITTVASDGTAESSSIAAGDGGPATNAILRYPSSVAADTAGNVFIADTSNNRIRRVAPNGIVTTVAGNGTQGFSGDGGPAINAQLQRPSGLALDGAGNLFFADSDRTRVRKVAAGGIITTVAGNGIRGVGRPMVDDGPATSIALSGYVGGVAVDAAGNLFVADDDRIRKVSPAGIMNTVAGGGTDRGDGGPATNAQLYPWGVVVDGGGNLLIADVGNRRIRKVSPAGIITTVAGTGLFSETSGDGGPATSAVLSAPVGLALDRAGNLFIADPGSDFVTGGETGLQPCCDYRIRKISPDGIITTVAGIGTAGFSGDGGPASTAALNGPLGVSVDGAGNVYIADSYNGAIRVLRPTDHSLLIGAVVDAANPRAGSVSPGKIVVIYGAGLGPAQLIENRASNGALGAELGGTTVSFNGIAAPILYTSATQVAAVVPYRITGTTAQVAVTFQGQVSNEFTVIVAASAPSLFTVNQEGSGQAAAINGVDGTVNTAANPVKIGAYISLYATGEGQTSPGGVDGKLGGSTPILPVKVIIGGIPATVQYSGGAQGLVAGLMQVNVQIPGGVEPGGYVSVVLQVGDTSTTLGSVWIAVAAN